MFLGNATVTMSIKLVYDEIMCSPNIYLSNGISCA
jgi:hypothetical protein